MSKTRLFRYNIRISYIHMPDTQTSPAEHVLLNWKAPIQPAFERSSTWYVVAGLIIVAVATYGILSGAWTLTLVSILTAAVYFLVRNHRLPDANVALTDIGIQVNDKF